MKYLLLFLFLVANGLHASAPKVMRVLLAIDSITNIKVSTKADTEHMREFLEFVAAVNNLSLDLKILRASDLNGKNIKAWLDNLKSDSNEVHLFYFTGHGYRTDGTKSKWPILFLPFYKQVLESPRITQAMKKKKPRLMIAIYDCCNGKPVQVIEPRSRKGQVLKSLNDYKGFQKLFSKTKGQIVLCGSTPGAYSYGTDRGGIFTNAFIIKSLEAAQLPEPSWNTLLDNVKVACAKYQVPQFDISLKE